MLFQFVKSISQFFSNFFQHRLTPACRLKRSMGMKYSTLSPFVKSNSKFFSIFFKSTARAAFQHLERSGIVIYHTFSFCQINFRKFFDFFQFQPRNNTRSASIIRETIFGGDFVFCDIVKCERQQYSKAKIKTEGAGS